MSLLSRFCAATALLALATATVHAAVEPTEVEQRKQEVVRATLERLGRVESGSAIVAAALQAEALESIGISGTPQETSVSLQFSGQPNYSVFLYDGGRKIVLDLTNTVNLQAGHVFTCANPSLVERVRTSLFALEPQFVSRAVIDLTAACDYRVQPTENGLLVLLTPKGRQTQTEVATYGPLTPEGIAPSSEILIYGPSPSAPTEVVAVAAVSKRALHSTEPDIPVYGPAVSAPAALDSTAPLRTASLPPTVQTASAPESPPSQPQGTLVLSQPVQSESTPAPPAQDRIRQLTHDLQAVKQSEFVPTVPMAPSLAAVTEDAPPAVAASSDNAASSSPPEASPPDANAAPPTETPPPAAAPDENAPPPPEKRPEPDLSGNAPGGAMTKLKQVFTDLASVAKNPAAKGVKTPEGLPEGPAEPQGDLMEQMVNIDFREMELSNVVQILSQKARVNVIGGSDLSGVVTASLKNITLRQAMDTILRMNDLGLVQEEGIYWIVPYADAQATNRATRMIKLETAKADDVRKTLSDVVKGNKDGAAISISVNVGTNVLIVSGPETRVDELEKLAKELDIAKPVMPTLTQAIKLNNADPKTIEAMLKGIITKEGQVTVDERGKNVIITDQPFVIEAAKKLVAEVDQPLKQVSIEAMIVDAVLRDNAQTGVDWILSAVKNLNMRGQPIGSLQDIAMENDTTGFNLTPGALTKIPVASRVTFGVLTGDFDLKQVIAAEVTNQDAKLLSTPVVVTVENKKATMSVSQEIPYIDFKQSSTGPAMSTTSFKEVGIVLEVTPSVSNDNHVISDIKAKQSDTKGELNGIPIEDKREATTTLRAMSGQTIYIGGLRRFDDQTSVKKLPILGDIPIMNALFRSNDVKKESGELLIFMTCTVLPDEMPDLTPSERAKADELKTIPKVPDSQYELFYDMMYPVDMRPSVWRRSE